MFLLPAASQVETEGTVVNTSRIAQWRTKVVEPLYESRIDHDILFDLCKKNGIL
ncbi:MAG: molybdopterin-dependent oxidoreductase [Aliarcobacter sp.]